MLTRKDLWDSFLDRNDFNPIAVCRNMVTGEWWSLDDPFIDVSKGLDNAVFVCAPTVMVDIPDEWLLPLTRRRRPPRGREVVWFYYLSDVGLSANIDRLRAGYCGRGSFDGFCNLIVGFSNHYRKIVARRNSFRG